MRTVVVTTTIRRPLVLESYLANFRAFEHWEVAVVVIGDRATPRGVGPYLSALAARTGYAIDYWPVDRQERLLGALPTLDRLLPYDSVQRRNLGYLIAADRGCDRIITIDDDNWPTGHDFLGRHKIVGNHHCGPAVSSSSGWFNSAGLLAVTPPKLLYHRGFPTSARDPATEHTYGQAGGRVVVNAGLWIGVPDEDATGHLEAPVTVTGLRAGAPARLAVAHGTNLVFNTQNTAFHRDLLPCMFLPPMGRRLGNLTVGRHDDVWMSMFLKPIADHLGDLVCVGEPLTEQRRNPHDLSADALVELPAMRLTDRLADTLATVVVTGSDYRRAYLGLANDLRSAIGGYPADERLFVSGLLDQMTAWCEVIRTFSTGP